MKMSCLFSVAGALVLAIGLSGVFAEEPPPLRNKASDRFVEARNRRTELLNKIQELKTDLEGLKRQKDALPTDILDARRELQLTISEVTVGLDRAKQQLAEAAPDSGAKKDLEEEIRRREVFLQEKNARLKSLTQSIDDPATGIKKQVEQVEQEIKSKRVELNQQQGALEVAEYKINELLNFELPRQSFKLWMSATFAALVGLVILGFFYIAWGDERVRQAIFSGTAGIQFVTLFSLVIAIILFGIIEILEGKELAALLGGLSGYILGRATSEHASAQPQQPSRDQSVSLGTQPQPPVQSQPALQPSLGNGAAQHA